MMKAKASDRPSYLSPVGECIPEEPKAKHQWVLWKSENRDGRWTKVPYKSNGGHAKSNDPMTWSTFDAVWKAYETGKFDGIGFVLNGDGIVGLDFDKCRCPAFDGTDEAIAESLVLPEIAGHLRLLNTYTEISPSGRGIRAILKGRLPVAGKKKGPIEVYQSGRYVTITGRPLKGYSLNVEERSIELLKFYADVFEKDKDGDSKEKKQKSSSNVEPWRELLKRAFLSQNGAEIKQLFEGDYSMYPSQSEADLALCSHLAFWFGGDKMAIDEAFRTSKLMREKWDEQHYGDGEKYGQATISKALEGCKTFYGDLTNDTSPSGKKGKVSKANKAIKIAFSKYELFHDKDNEAFATFITGDRPETCRVLSKGFKSRLAKDYWTLYGEGLGSKDISDAIITIEGKAQNEGPCHTVFLRTAVLDDAIYVDIGDENRTIIKITASGWCVDTECKIKFLRPPGMAALPYPEKGGSIDTLMKYANLEDMRDWCLLVAFIIGCFHPFGPYPGLEVTGEQGSAKSTLLRIIMALVDPSTTAPRVVPKSMDDLAISASNSWIICFDNVSVIPDWLSDALCRLCTGGGFATRTLYSNRDETLFYAKRPFMLNCIEYVIRRSDLADRIMSINLKTIPDDQRIPENKFWAEFNRDAPGILGAVLDAVSCALRNYKNTKLERMPRMADFAIWVVSAEPALGWEPGSFLKEYARNRKETISLAVESSPILTGIRDLIINIYPEGWKGTMGELLRLLNMYVDKEKRQNKWWPTTPNHLSGVLKRGAPALRQEGIEVDLSRKMNTGRMVILRPLSSGVTMVTLSDAAKPIQRHLKYSEDTNSSDEE